MYSLLGKMVTRDMVLAVLSESKNLSVKDIQTSIKARFIKTVGYNRVYEAVMDALRKQYIQKNQDGSYSLSGGWLENINDFVSKANKTYSDPVNMTRFELGKVQLHNFNSVTEMDRFIKEFEESFTAKINKKHFIFWNLKHTWWSLLYPKDEIDLIDSAKKHGIEYHMLINGSTPLDNHVCEFYRDCGAHVLRGAFFQNQIMAVYADIILKFVYPAGFLDGIDEIFNSMKKINLKDFSVSLQKLYSDAQPCAVILFKDPQLSQFYRAYLNKAFKA